MRLTLFSVCVALALPSAAVSQTFRAPNAATATVLQSGDIEVFSPRSKSAQFYWCGVADYIIRYANVPSSSRIYIVEGRTKVNGRETVTFSLSPPAGIDPQTARNPLSIGGLRVGDSLTGGAAIQYCYSRQTPDR